MADDQGYETIAANGRTSYKTPNIDRLAANGMRFEMPTRTRSARLRASR
jgi:arylsulfatase A